MTRLKEATRPQHEALETRVDLGSLIATRPGYAALVGRFLGFYEPAEARLDRVEGWGGAGLDLEARRKAPLLRADLRALGFDDPAIAALPRFGGVIEPADLTEALGLLYVMEGATLGGQYIRKSVEKSLGLHAGAGASFFASYGEGVGPMWKAFGSSVASHVEPLGVEAEDRLIAAATGTFAAMEGWLAGEGWR